MHAHTYTRIIELRTSDTLTKNGIPKGIVKKRYQQKVINMHEIEIALFYIYCFAYKYKQWKFSFPF